MSNSFFHRFDDIDAKELFPGYIARLIHTAANTFNFLEVTAGSAVPLHQHMHHQTAFVLEGVFEMTIDGETQLLTPGMYADIPPNIPHGGKAISDCKLLDVFNPVREDYR